MSHDYIFPQGEIKRCFFGAVEIASFLKQGIQRFSNTAEEAMRSFYLFFAVFPLHFAFLYYVQKNIEEYQSTSYIELCYFNSIRLVSVMVVTLLSVFTISHLHKKKSFFPRFVAGSNWLLTIQIIFYTPLMVMLLTGIHNLEELQRLEIIFLLYFNIMYGFFIAYCLEIRWPKAALLTLYLFILDDLSFEIMKLFL